MPPAEVAHPLTWSNSRPQQNKKRNKIVTARSTLFLIGTILITHHTLLFFAVTFGTSSHVNFRAHEKEQIRNKQKARTGIHTERALIRNRPRKMHGKNWSLIAHMGGFI